MSRLRFFRCGICGKIKIRVGNALLPVYMVSGEIVKQKLVCRAKKCQSKAAKIKQRWAELKVIHTYETGLLVNIAKDGMLEYIPIK